MRRYGGHQRASKSELQKVKGSHSKTHGSQWVIKRALLAAEIPSRLEPASHNKRPDGVTKIPWSRGQILAWDCTCPDTLAASHLNVAVTGLGQVANHAEQLKIDKYAALSKELQFIPIAIETLGPVGEEAIRFLQESDTGEFEIEGVT